MNEILILNRPIGFTVLLLSLISPLYMGCSPVTPSVSKFTDHGGQPNGPQDALDNQQKNKDTTAGSGVGTAGSGEQPNNSDYKPMFSDDKNLDITTQDQLDHKLKSDNIEESQTIVLKKDTTNENDPGSKKLKTLLETGEVIIAADESLNGIETKVGSVVPTHTDVVIITNDRSKRILSRNKLTKKLQFRVTSLVDANDQPTIEVKAIKLTLKDFEKEKHERILRENVDGIALLIK